MKNFLQSPPTESALLTLFQNHPPTSILPPESDPLWQSIAKKPPLQPILQTLRQQAIAELNEPLPILTDALYADYTQTGTRINFESLYFERRRRLARAAIATLIESDPVKKQRFQKSLQQKAQDIYDESSWALPAHVTSLTGKDPLTTDLFAAETANTFAELLTLFPISLSKEFHQQVRHRLRTQFFKNYLVIQPHWLTGTSNWNAVCHQGVLGAALTIEDDAILLAKMFTKAAQYLPNYLQGFTPDGATAEGPGYWSYGFGWFTELNAQLEHRTNNQLSLFHENPLLPLMARFGPTVALSNNNLVNFADSAPTGGLRPALLQYLADRLNDPTIAAAANHFWANIKDETHGQRSDLFHWTRLLLRCPNQLLAAAPLPIQDIFLPHVAWLITRSIDNKNHLWEFAAKAGHNLEHHNHNDVGSYLLNIDGQRLILEIGAPEYVKAFFKAETRYQFLPARSLGHSVPLINNCEQPDGKDFAGTVLEQSSTPTDTIFTLDLTHAYPKSTHLTRYTRHFHLNKPAGKLTITDAFTLTNPQSLETAIITPNTTTQENNTALATAGPITLRITPSPGTKIQTLQPHTYNRHNGTPDQITRIILTPESLTPATTLSYTLDLT